MVRTVAAVSPLSAMLLSWALACSANTVAAQPPLPPPPGANVPRGPNMPANRPATPPPSTAGSSGVLRVMIPDSTSAPAAPSAGIPAAPPTGSGRPSFPAPAGAQPPVGAGSQPRAGAGAPSNDPTVPNSEIRRILEGTGRDNAPPPAPAIPTMRVRARVFVSGQPPVAVLEIGGRQLTVREGSEIHLLGGDSPAGMQLRVARMTAGEIRLEVVNKNQFITLD